MAANPQVPLQTRRRPDDMYKRHNKYYDPHTQNRPIHILGCGSLGGTIAVMLAKLGLTDFTLYDFDTVEAHNIPNQPFSVPMIGLKKDVAVQGMIAGQHLDSTQLNITLAGKFTNKSTIPEGCVLINVPDKITLREDAALAAPSNCFIIDARTGPESYNIFTCDKQIPKQWEFYKRSFFAESESVSGGCGAQSTPWGSGDVAAMVVNCYMRYVREEPVPAQINADLLTLEREQIYLER